MTISLKKTELQVPPKRLWSAEPAGESLEHQTDIVLRMTLPNGGQYCHRFAVDSRRESYLVMAEMPVTIKTMDDTLTMLLERGFSE